MRRVAILGLGMVPVREHWEKSLRELAVDALRAAMEDAQRDTVDGIIVGNMLSGELSAQEHLGALVADYAGFSGVEAVKVEAACASGSAAFRQGVMAVASGMKDCVAVVGVEKLTEHAGRYTTAALATAADADFETSVGITFVALNALVMQRFLYENKVDREDFAQFPILAHQNAQYNANAMFRKPFSVEQYNKAKMIADPINLMDSSPIADGAAAVILVPLEEAKSHRRAVEVCACEIGTDTIALHDRDNLLHLRGVERSARRAYATAGITPEDVSLFEPHDAFTIMTLLSMQYSGFLSAVEALQKVKDGYFAIDGKLPITTMGGLKGRGHPVGATGVYQIVEAAIQLRAEAPEKIQVSNPRYAMTQNVGGTGATVVTTILKPAKT